MPKIYAEKPEAESRVEPAIVGNTVIAGGSVVRTAIGNIQVDFGYTFKRPPHVVVSPHLKEFGPVGFIETIIHIGTTSFILASFNALDNYKIEWIALGEKP